MIDLTVHQDSLERNARDTARKLGREERLVGPALLSLKHGNSIPSVAACKLPRTHRWSLISNLVCNSGFISGKRYWCWPYLQSLQQAWRMSLRNKKRLNDTLALALDGKLALVY